MRKRASSSSAATKEEPTSNKDLNHCPLSILPELDEGNFAGFDYQLPTSDYDFSASFTGPLSLLAPGGGLRQLDLSFDETSFMFDSVFADQKDFLDSGYETSVYTPSDTGLPQYPVRGYSCDQDM
jgi:hypothetical protein